MMNIIYIHNLYFPFCIHTYIYIWICISYLVTSRYIYSLHPPVKDFEAILPDLWAATWQIASVRGTTQGPKGSGRSDGLFPEISITYWDVLGFLGITILLGCIGIFWDIKNFIGMYWDVVGYANTFCFGNDLGHNTFLIGIFDVG